MNRLSQTQEKTLTLAEVCEALASGKLQAKVENGSYHIRRSDLRSLARRGELAAAQRSGRRIELAS